MKLLRIIIILLQLSLKIWLKLLFSFNILGKCRQNLYTLRHSCVQWFKTGIWSILAQCHPHQTLSNGWTQQRWLKTQVHLTASSLLEFKVQSSPQKPMGKTYRFQELFWLEERLTIRKFKIMKGTLDCKQKSNIKKENIIIPRMHLRFLSLSSETPFWFALPLLKYLLINVAKIYEPKSGIH